MSTHIDLPPAGWYPDKRETELLRYWDGTSWTANTATRGVADWPAEPKDLNGSRLDAWEAVKSGYRNTFRYQGRASRSAFWWFQVCVGFFWFALSAAAMWTVTTAADLDSTAAQSDVTSAVFLAVVGAGLVAYFIPTVALTVRRLHDINQSGWWTLIYFAPAGQLVLLVLTVLPGTRGPNRFDLPVLKVESAGD